MRTRGLATSAAGAGLHDHLCWLYDDDAARRAAAVEFMRDGLRLGQRLIYVAEGDADRLRCDLSGLPDVDAFLDEGRLEIVPLGSMYRAGAGLDPDVALAAYATATERALADGYTGIRVVAEVTPLARDPQSWMTQTRWESLADHFMATNPMAALCCYDRRVLPDAIAHDLACAHPAANVGGAAVPFRMYASPDCLFLEGEVDCFSAGRLERVLAARPPGFGVDLAGIRFMDHHALGALVAAGAQLRSVPGPVRRVADLLGVAL